MARWGKKCKNGSHGPTKSLTQLNNGGGEKNPASLILQKVFSMTLDHNAFLQNGSDAPSLNKNVDLITCGFISINPSEATRRPDVQIGKPALWLVWFGLFLFDIQDVSPTFPPQNSA